MRECERETAIKLKKKGQRKTDKILKNATESLREREREMGKTKSKKNKDRWEKKKDKQR